MRRNRIKYIRNSDIKFDYIGSKIDREMIAKNIGSIDRKNEENII